MLFKVVYMKKNMNVVIVHGCNDNEEDGLERPKENERHWKPWLKKELENHGIDVSNELYPRDWDADYGEWKKVFEKNKIDENTILVGHSCGGAFLVRWLSETNQKIKKLILVAPAKRLPGMKEKYLKFYTFKPNEKVKNNIGEIVIFVSNDESPGIKKAVELYKQELNAKVIELKNHGHFTLGDMGTEEFPELLEEILK